MRSPTAAAIARGLDKDCRAWPPGTVYHRVGGLDMCGLISAPVSTSTLSRSASCAPGRAPHLMRHPEATGMDAHHPLGPFVVCARLVPWQRHHGLGCLVLHDRPGNLHELPAAVPPERGAAHPGWPNRVCLHRHLGFCRNDRDRAGGSSVRRPTASDGGGSTALA